MTDAILAVLEGIKHLILDTAKEGSWFTCGLETFNETLYGFTSKIVTEVVKPVAYTILALFFVLELYRASVRTEGMGGGSNNLGAEVVFKVMFRMVICKIVVDHTDLILNAIFMVTTELTTKTSGILGNSPGGGYLGLDGLKAAIDALDFWSGLVCLLMCFIIYLISMIAVAIASVVVVTRFIELYVYVAIAPIPLATLPSDEMSQIGKGFLKSFAAVSLQGTLIFIVLGFFPYLIGGAFVKNNTTGDIFLSLLGVMGYSIALILAVFSAGKWAKTICNAM